MAGSLHYLKLMQREHLSNAAIQSLTWAAQGVLTNLRCHHWEAGGIVDDEEKIVRLIGGNPKEARKVWAELRPLFNLRDGILVLPGDIEQRDETMGKIARNKERDSEKSGGRPRKNSETITKPNGFGLGNQNETDTKHKPESESYTEDLSTTTPPVSSPSGERGVSWNADREAAFQKWFLQFKAAYPKRHGGNYDWAKAERKLRTLIKQGLKPSKVMDGLARYRAMLEADDKIGSRFVKMAATWVNAYGWDDDYPVVLKVEKGGKSVDETPEQVAERRAMVAR